MIEARTMLIAAVAMGLAAFVTRGETAVERETISTNAFISVKPHLQLMGETSVGVVWTTREKADGYTGGVSCECGWGKGGDLAKNLETALKTMKGLV